MNYLILTPDGVGSTILQRILTMCLHLKDLDVTNTHELTNGLALNNGLATKDFDLFYSQSLPQIADIINSSSPKTILVSRLAKYHIDQRNDSMHDQDQFYNFLQEKFGKIIMCVRENIFEYALSWSIREKTDVRNIYSKEDKQKVLSIDQVDEQYFLRKCQEYVFYVRWVEDNFPDVVKISYEQLIHNHIPPMLDEVKAFKKLIGCSLSEIIKNEHKIFNDWTWSELTSKQQQALIKYRMTAKELIEKKIIINMPLKNTTLLDKQKQIKNFDNCLQQFYMFAKNHNWIDQSIATYDFWNKQNIC